MKTTKPKTDTVISRPLEFGSEADKAEFYRKHPHIPGSPSDAADLNAGKPDVLKPASHTPEYSIQNQCQLLNPNTGSPITGDRLFIGDTVAGEWYDTGNEVMAPRIVETINACSGMADPAATIEALKDSAAQWAASYGRAAAEADNAAATIEALKSALEAVYTDLDLDNLPTKFGGSSELAHTVRSALALCARDGKGEVSK